MAMNRMEFGCIFSLCCITNRLTSKRMFYHFHTYMTRSTRIRMFPSYVPWYSFFLLLFFYSFSDSILFFIHFFAFACNFVLFFFSFSVLWFYYFWTLSFLSTYFAGCLVVVLFVCSFFFFYWNLTWSFFAFKTFLSRLASH